MRIGAGSYDGISTAWNINNATFFKASMKQSKNSKCMRPLIRRNPAITPGAGRGAESRAKQSARRAFEFVRNNDFDARNYFRPAR